MEKMQAVTVSSFDFWKDSLSRVGIRLEIELSTSDFFKGWFVGYNNNGKDVIFKTKTIAEVEYFCRGYEACFLENKRGG